MFSGIIKQKGILKNIYKTKKDYTIKIHAKIKLSKDDIGSSICCSGVCLTLTKLKGNILTFYMSNETLKKSNFKSLKKGNIINLEKPIKFGEHISGHFVQGHVDTTTRVKKVRLIGKSHFISLRTLNKYKKYLVYKGSIAVNGVSLTISKILKKEFQVVIIPYTLKLTNLENLRINDIVNIEFDILGKYINNLRNA